METKLWLSLGGSKTRIEKADSRLFLFPSLAKAVWLKNREKG